jgi:hypothetical protein
MKRIICILLCAAMLHLSGELPDHQARAQTSGAVLVMFCAIVGTILVMWVYKVNSTPKLRWLVLEKCHYDGNWVPVATNQVFVTAYLARAFPAFQSSMTDDTASYRIKEIDPPAPNFRVGIIPGSAEQPFLYTVQ